MSKRKEGESFEDYKARRKREQKELKARMAGRVIFRSTRIVETGEKDEVGRPELSVQKRTYRSGDALDDISMENRNKYDRMLRKAKRREKSKY